MAQDVRYLLIGAGLAGVHAAEAIRKADPEGSILMVGDEAYPPYNRPPISKQFLLDDHMKLDHLYLRKDVWYHRQKVELRKGCKVTGLNLEERFAILHDTSEVKYSKLLLGMGCRLKRLDLPGAEHVHYIRTVDESKAVKGLMKSGRTAAVIGGGFLGLELASAFSQRGMKVTQFERGPRLWSRLLDPQLSDWLLRVYQKKGVNVRLNTEVTAVEKNSVTLGDGSSVAADVVFAGVGVEPDMSLLKGTPLDGPDGVETDEFLETRVAGVFAAGDLAHYSDQVFGGRRRVEHWDTAMRQGKRAGANMAGTKEPYDGVPYFFSDLFDLQFEFIGDFEGGWDAMELSDPLDGDKWGAVYLRNGRIVAALHTNGGGRSFKDLETAIRKAAAPIR